MKIIIIGAGIAGLSAGIYARQSGIDATIFESHTIPGGNSTGWKRGGYFFEGGMHWLVGSSPKTPLNKLWKEVGALQENNPIYNRDPFFTYLDGGETISLYRDEERLLQSLTAVSAQDEEAVRGLVNDIKALKNTSMPVMDIKGVKVHHKSSISMGQVMGYVKSGKTMGRLMNLTVREYIAGFKHEGIRELLGSVVGNQDFSALSLLFTLAGTAAGDGGYPEGGSVRMAQNMADTFRKLGGVIEYNKKAERVSVTKSKADGVWAGGVRYEADAVIVASDTISASDQLFEKPLKEPWVAELKKETVPLNCIFISLGVAADLSRLPENMVLPLKEPLQYCGTACKSLLVNHYAAFKGYAPKGCTALTTVLGQDTYDEWKKAAEEGVYSEKKQELADLIIDRLSQIIPEIKGRIEVWDVATPLTYERYCGTWRGSWMSVMKPGMGRRNYPCRSETIGNLYFAGQRLSPPGGVPNALTTGRTAVQHLCKDTGRVFQNKLS